MRNSWIEDSILLHGQQLFGRSMQDLSKFSWESTWLRRRVDQVNWRSNRTGQVKFNQNGLLLLERD